jgi:hypothetical protein
MNQRRLKAMLRAFAIVAGLFGALSLYMGVGFLVLAVFGKAPDRLKLFMAMMFLIPGVYLSWVVFLVWRRFSPRAVLHLCGGIGFLVWTTIPVNDWFEQFGDSWSAVAWWVWVALVISGFSSLSRYLIRRLFEAEVLAPQVA